MVVKKLRPSVIAILASAIPDLSTSAVALTKTGPCWTQRLA